MTHLFDGPKWLDDLYRVPKWLDDVYGQLKQQEEARRNFASAFESKFFLPEFTGGLTTDSLLGGAHSLASVIPDAMKAIELRESATASRLQELMRANENVFGPSSPVYETLQRQEYLASELTGSLRHARELYNAPLSSLASLAAPAASTTGYEVLFRDVASNALGSWHRALDQSAVDMLAASLAEQAEADPDTRIVDAVTEAVTRVLREREGRTDWRFVVQLVISILILLCADVRSTAEIKKATEKAAEPIAQKLKAVERRLLLQDELLRTIATRDVQRGARLFARPSSRSRMLGLVEAGTRVIVVERRNKWTKVAVPDTSENAVPATGWMLNKYLARRVH